MEAKLSFRYDRVGDILYLDKTPPYAGQESQEISDGIIARLNPTTGEIETLEILFFSTRLLRSDFIDMPVEAAYGWAESPRNNIVTAAGSIRLPGRLRSAYIKA